MTILLLTLALVGLGARCLGAIYFDVLRVGTVAEIEKKKVSALLVYNEHTNIGKVLIARK